MTNASAGWWFVLVMGSVQCVGGLRVQCVVRMSNVLLGWHDRCVPELVSNASAWWWVSKLSPRNALKLKELRS